MKLQQILTSYRDDEKTVDMYYGVKGDISAEGSGDNKKIRISKDSSLLFGTYFNGFFIEKWNKYTIANNFGVAIKGRGTALVSLFHIHFEGERLSSDIVCQDTFDLSKEARITIPDIVKEGMVFPIVKAETEVVIDEAYYYGDTDGEPRDDVRLALDICTFKREPYVKRNITSLTEHILTNAGSPLYGKAEVFISDNACTLGNMLDGFEHVKVMPNENVGGVGGFTRGMIEAMKDDSITHILIMDDDAVIEPSAVEKTYMFLTMLKPEYREHTIGGQLLRENTPHIQYEAGANWNRGKIKALHHHLNVAKWIGVLENDKEDNIEYAGWWYSCIPVSEIKKEGLPLPLFIHRDDIEYGMRTGQNRFIYLNGIGVWHEAFENKMPGANEYYDWRNMAIINCIHYEDYSKRELKRFLFKWVTANIIRYRYKYVDMNLRGVEDFLRGIDWFKQQGGQALHGEIMAMNYKAKPVVEYVGYKGLKEEELLWDNIEKVEAGEPSKIRKILQMMTFNGYFFKPKDDKVLVAMPHDNIYDMYRKQEVLYVDSNSNGLLLKRNLKEALSCYRKYRNTKKLINKRFDEVKKEYRERYTELTGLEFWNEYLKL